MDHIVPLSKLHIGVYLKVLVNTRALKTLNQQNKRKILTQPASLQSLNNNVLALAHSLDKLRGEIKEEIKSSNNVIDTKLEKFEQRAKTVSNEQYKFIFNHA